MMMMMGAMRGVRRSLCVVVSLVLLSAVCVSAGKLWGVDVGKKEDKGEFASLLNKATGMDRGDGAGGGIGDEVGSILAQVADMDLSQLSLSELGTNVIDMFLETIKDEQFISQFAEPGVVGELAQNSGLSALLGEDGMASVEKDDLLALLALEDSPILYKTKFYEIVDKFIGKTVAFRMDVANPVKLRRLVLETLQAAGLDQPMITQIMEVVEHPEIMAQQIKAMASDPTVIEQAKAAAEGFMTGMEVGNDMDYDDDELMEMLAAMGQEDPEMMEQIIAEIMKDPALAESLDAEGGAAGLFKGMGGGAGRQGLAAEL
ncbi:unnamed protein product [Ectocarpus sp. 6 AP-2014]